MCLIALPQNKQIVSSCPSKNSSQIVSTQSLPPASHQTRALPSVQRSNTVHTLPNQRPNGSPLTQSTLTIKSIFLLRNQNKGFTGGSSSYSQRAFHNLTQPRFGARKGDENLGMFLAEEMFTA